MDKNRIKKGLLGGVIFCGIMFLAGCGSQEEMEEKERVETAEEGNMLEEYKQTIEEGNAEEEYGQTIEEGNAEEACIETTEEEISDENMSQESTSNEKQDEAEEPEVELKDMTVSIFGDSISTFEGFIPENYQVFYPGNGEVTAVEQTWWKMVLDDTGLQLCVNGSSSGSTCAGDSTSIDNPWFGCGDYRIGGLFGKDGSCPNIILVYIGTNDLMTGVPLGENDGLGQVEEGVIENFSDAYSLILDKLAATYPDAQIFCCNLTPIGDWGTEQPFITFTNGLGFTSEDYSQRIEKIAQTKGYPVIDLQHCGITIDNMQQYVTDGVHLNPEGMKLVRDMVEVSLRTFYQK